MKRPKRSDVARLAGVSSATVSYVVNSGPRPVAAETRARVLAAIRELNYHPHAVARSLSKGKTQTVGFLAPSLVSAFMSHLVDALEEKLASRGYGLLVASSHEDSARESHLLKTLAGQSIDGLLFDPTSDKNGDQVQDLVAHGLPVVFVDRYIAGVPADAVTTDNVEAARHATNYLIRKGCKRCICISFSDEASSALDRVKGFRKALAENGMNVDEHPVSVVKYTMGDTVSAHLSEYVTKSGVPDGILCTTDWFFIETVKFLRAQGIRVPGQVEVTGSFFFSPWNEILDPPLPIVCQDYSLIADRAVDYLIERIEGTGPASAPRLELVPANYIHEENEGDQSGHRGEERSS